MGNPAKRVPPVFMVNGGGRVVRVPRVGDGYPIPEGWRAHDNKPASRSAPDSKPAAPPAKEH